MVGVGIDIVEIQRIQAIIERFKERFLKRVFTDEEIDFCERRPDLYQSFGARFAAKEAILKALGTGKSKGIRWKDMEILADEQSRPIARLHGELKNLVPGRLHLSLSHTQNSAIAVCILEG